MPIVPHRAANKEMPWEGPRVQGVSHEYPIKIYLLYGAYSWLLIGGVLHFGIDVISQYVRGKRAPAATTTLYYGLNSAYALGQFLFAALALFAIWQGVVAMGQWSGLLLGFSAASAWLVVSLLFLEYREPRMVITVFALLLVGAAISS